MRTIGIAIPTYNRFHQTIDSFKQVLPDERIGEVTIVDDASTDDSYEKLVDFCIYEERIKIYRNNHNIDCYFNKCNAITRSTLPWQILLDSDNTIDTSYLDALYAIDRWEDDTIYQPSWAAPHFDFRKWSGLTITKENVAEYVDTHLMTSLNACNHFVNRDQYLKVWDGSVDPVTSDSIYFCYKWLESGRKIFMTPNLEYDHYISPNNDGHYQQNYRRTGNFHQVVLDKIKELK